MKTTVKNNKATRGFTLVEMIGVLAVIAILAGMLIPKIFEAIRNSRINATLEAYNTLKAAVLENYAKWGRFAYGHDINDTQNSQTTAATQQYTGSSFDYILFKEGRIDARAADKIPLSTSGGTDNVYVNVVAGKGNNGSGYDLDGDGTAETANAAYTVELIIKSVAVQDAQDLSLRLDGKELSANDLTTTDTKGRVEYGTITDKKTDVYIYIAHQ